MLAALVLGLGVPTLAMAQLGPTNIPAPLTQTEPSDDAAPVDDEGGLSTLQLVLIFGTAIGVIAGIGWLIMRDARQAAPAAARASRAAEAASGAPGSKGKSKSAREREREKARQRKKAKAARDQRKRNRPR